METLSRLSELLRQRNSIDSQISAVIGRPAITGHLGEFIASQVFGIKLAEAANRKGIDGHFTSGGLAGCSVNVKFYPKQQWFLDISEALPDYYLVLAGPSAPVASSRGTTLPFAIHSVYLFDAAALISTLKSSAIKVGVATSVKRHLWAQAETFPESTNPSLTLTDEQRRMLAMFSPAAMTTG